jgi:hypothetical protein
VPDFVGRRGEVDRLVQFLTRQRPAGVPVAVIHGRSGIGKTTLATRVGHTLRLAFDGGQLFTALRAVDLRPLEPFEVLAGFLRVLGVEPQLIPRTLSERAAMYRELASQRRLLVVVDDAESAAQVRPLLPGSVGSGVLVTSRVRLDSLEGAEHVELAAMSVQDGATLLGRIAGAPRVAAEPEAAGAIVRFCEGLPLAVRIAGVRLAQRKNRPVAWLAGLLSSEGRRLDELSVDDLAVKTALHVAYQRLEPSQRLLMRRLALVDAAHLRSWMVWPLTGAASAPAEGAMEALADAGLLEPDGEPATADIAGFRMHGLVRAFARGQADVEDDPDVRRDTLVRVFGAALHLLDIATAVPLNEFAAPSASPATRHQVSAAATDAAGADRIGWLERHRDTLVSLTLQACDIGLLDHAWALGELLYPFFDLRHYYDDLTLTHAHLRRAAAAAGHGAAEAHALFGLFEVDYSADRAGSIELLQAALDICHRLGLRRKALALELTLANFDRLQGRHSEANRRAVTALRASRELADPMLHAHALQVTALTVAERDDPRQAIPMLRSARLIYRQSGCMNAECQVMYRLATVHRRLGHSRATHAYLTRALAMAIKLNSPQAIATIGVALGELQTDTGALSEAETTLLGCRESFHRMGRLAGLSSTELALTKLYLRTGDLDNAQASLRRARDAASVHKYAIVLQQIDDLLRTDARCADWLTPHR